MLIGMFKSLFVSAYPNCLEKLFSLRSSKYYYILRGNNVLNLPEPRRTTYGLESIKYKAEKLWNSLTDDMRLTISIEDFKKSLMTECMDLAKWKSLLWHLNGDQVIGGFPPWGGPFLFICVLVMLLIRVFQNERFNRFLRFFASLININDGTLRKCYLFTYRYKNFWDIGIYLKPHFNEKWK